MRNEWKKNGVHLAWDFRNYDKRPRLRVRVPPVCHECAPQGLLTKAQKGAWCRGLCRHHAVANGLKDRMTRSKCINCKCIARTNAHGWARGFCQTHAIENECEDPHKKKLGVKVTPKVKKKPVQGVKQNCQKKPKKFNKVKVKKEPKMKKKANDDAEKKCIKKKKVKVGYDDAGEKMCYDEIEEDEPKVTLWPRGVVHSGYGKLDAEQEADTEMDTDSHDDKDLQAGKAGGEAGGEVFVEAHAAGSEEAKEAEDSEEEEEEDEDDSKSVRSDTTYYAYVPKSWDLSPAASGSVFFPKRPHPPYTKLGLYSQLLVIIYNYY
jgi:hypothetical protein